MIKLQNSGWYKLIETQHHTKILYLDGEAYAWVRLAEIGEMLVASHNPHRTDYVLSAGLYRLYEVEDEAYLSDQIHLELEAGKNCWQGYLLLSGLPDSHKIRGRIIPTQEVITGNPKFARRKDLRQNQAVVGDYHKERRLRV